MLTAEGVIGKVVSLIVDKTIGKLIDLPLDKRKKACRSLTKLYYCVQTLDDVTEEFYRTLSDFESDGDSEAMVHALNNNRYYIELATNMFIELGWELHEGLEIIDPTLARCCSLLYVSKFDFLTYMSNSIEWDRSKEKPHLKVKIPTDKMLSVDLKERYNKVNIALSKGDKYYWPSTALDDFRDNIEDISVSFDDSETARHLKEHLDKHRALLGQAKERLRNLLKESFSIEEILFQNDSHPWR